MTQNSKLRTQNRFALCALRYAALILIFLSSLFFFLNPSTDADLGWHLGYGRHFSQTGQLLKTNQFSTQMPDYTWPNHSWGFDILSYQLFQSTSFLGLSLVAALLIATSLTIVLSRQRLYSAIPLAIFFFFGNHLLNTGLRSQLFSLLFTAILWFLLLKIPELPVPKPEKSFLKSLIANRYSQITLLVLPAVFLLWANFHGQYIFGLVIYLIFILTYHDQNLKSQISNLKSSSSKQIKISTKHLSTPSKTLNPKPKTLLYLSFLLSCLVTLLNPFGTNLVETTFSHFNSQAFPHIMEWMPWEWGTPRMTGLLLYTLILGIALWQVRRHQPTHPVVQTYNLVILLLLAVFAFKARRIISFYLLVSLPTTASLLEYYQHVYLLPWLKQHRPNLKNPPRTLVNLNLSLLVFLTALTTYQLIQKLPSLTNQTWTTYCDASVLCSEPLLEYMKQHQIQGKIFNSYRLGGWLIYRYPEAKVYIDGRMTLWEEKTGVSPFLRYLGIIHTKPGSYEVFRAEDFDYVIIHPPFNLHQVLTTQLNWPILYQDEKLTLFQNPTATLSATSKPSSKL